MREKYRAAEEEARAHHYDSTKEGTLGSLVTCLPSSLSNRPGSCFAEAIR